MAHMRKKAEGRRKEGEMGERKSLSWCFEVRRMKEVEEEGDGGRC